MEVTGGEEDGFVREWTPCSHLLSLIPTRLQHGIFSSELCITCLDSVNDYIALGTNVGIVYWYDRKKGTIQKLKCESSSSITFIKIVNTVDYMVGAGNTQGQVTVFQIPKEHPDSVPEALKPKVEPKVERYTIGDLHKSKVTAIAWSKNGMRLFSGDKNGVIIMSEIDFYMHICKSMEIVNEEHEIVQMSYHQNTLLVSSMYRTILCEKTDTKWQVSQLGKKERKSLCPLGAVFQYSFACGGAAVAYCARQGQRLWKADKSGNVLQTLLFKEAISNPLTIAELLNPTQSKPNTNEKELNFGPLYVFREHFLVSHNDEVLYILDPRSLTAVAVVDNLRRILSVSVNNDEIFVLEGPRSIVRLGHTPEAGTMKTEPLMSKSLTTTFHQAVNTVRVFTQEQTVPFITSVFEPILSDTPISQSVQKAEECFELPPVKNLPADITDVLQSIDNEFKISEMDNNKVDIKMLDMIKSDGDLVFSRRSKKREEVVTPRMLTPVRKDLGDVSYTSPCVMNVSVHSNVQETDDELEKQIEEKERILAKMLNIDSLSISSTNLNTKVTDDEIKSTNESANTVKNYSNITHLKKPSQINKTGIKKDKIMKVDNINKSYDRNDGIPVPKVVEVPNTWNLKLKLDNICKVDENDISSPDLIKEGGWDFI